MIAHLIRVLALACLLSCQLSDVSALVDMKNANYTNTWIDYDSQDGFSIVRTYNSRSLNIGILGFGWCTDFETAIGRQQDDLVLTHCGAGMSVVFRYQGSEEGGRARFVDENGATAVIDESGGIAVTSRHGDLLKFDQDGRLIFKQDKGGRPIQILRDGPRIGSIRTPDHRIELTWSTSGKVLSFVVDEKLLIQYAYDDQDNLIYARNGWNNIYLMSYNDFHNLTRAEWPDQTFIEVRYDDANDWAIGLIDRNRCVEEYGYHLSKFNPRNHYWNTVKKTCKGQVIANDKYETLHVDVGDTPFLRTRTTVNGFFDDVIYFSRSGERRVLVANQAVGELHAELPE